MMSHTTPGRLGLQPVGPPTGAPIPIPTVVHPPTAAPTSPQPASAKLPILNYVVYIVVIGRQNDGRQKLTKRFEYKKEGIKSEEKEGTFKNKI
jgi:hypothetical protein